MTEARGMKAGGGKARALADAATRKARGTAPEALLFAPVLLAPMTVAGIWQTRLASDMADVPWYYGLIGPACLGLAALYCALLAERMVKAGHSALILRASVVAYAAVDAASAAWYVHHEARPWQEAALVGFFAASAVWLWDRRSRLRFRQVLDGQGRLDKPLPHFRFLRWLLFTRETWWAFKVAVRDGISRNDEALALGRAELARHREAKAARKAEAKTPAAPAAKPRVEAPKAPKAKPSKGAGGTVTDLSGREAEDKAHLARIREEAKRLGRVPKREEVKALCRVASTRADALIHRYREEAAASDDDLSDRDAQEG